MIRNPHRYAWIAFFLLFGFSILIFEMDGTSDISASQHRIDLTLAIFIGLVAVATLLYLRARTRITQKQRWWDDDDWSNWGGI